MHPHAPILLLLSILSAACIPHRTGMPPIVSPGRVRQTLVVGKQFRVVVFDFGSKDDSKQENNAYLERALPAMILSSLKKETVGPRDHQIPRFAVYDAGIARRNQAIIEEKNANEFADAYLTGTIVGRRTDEVCFEARLANAVNHEVLFVAATPTCAKLKPGDAGAHPKIAEAAIVALAAEITKAVLTIEKAKILSADGKLVVVDKGSDAGVLAGMPAYIVDTGVATADPAVAKLVGEYSTVPEAESVERAPAIIGEIYVLSVERKHCLGLLFRGDYALPGDSVYFK